MYITFRKNIKIFLYKKGVPDRRHIRNTLGGKMNLFRILDILPHHGETRKSLGFSQFGNALP